MITTTTTYRTPEMLRKTPHPVSPIISPGRRRPRTRKVQRGNSTGCSMIVMIGKRFITFFMLESEETPEKSKNPKQHLNERIDKLRQYLTNPNQNDKTTKEEATADLMNLPQPVAEEKITNALLAKYHQEKEEEREEPHDVPSHLPKDMEEDKEDQKSQASLSQPPAPPPQKPYHLAYNALQISDDPNFPNGLSNTDLKPENVQQIYGVEEPEYPAVQTNFETENNHPPNFVVDPNPLDYINAYMAQYEDQYDEEDRDDEMFPVQHGTGLGEQDHEDELIVSKETFNKMLASETGGYGLNGDDYPERDQDRGSLILTDVISAEDTGPSSSEEFEAENGNGNGIGTPLEQPGIYEPFENQLNQGNVLPQYPSPPAAASSHQGDFDPPPQYNIRKSQRPRRKHRKYKANENTNLPRSDFISLQRRRFFSL